jgi:hypothetical protein
MTEIRGQRNVVIQKPINEVFEYISDFSRHNEWNHQILEISVLSDGPLGVGTKLQAREQAPRGWSFFMKLLLPIMSRLMKMRNYTEAEIVEWDPPNRLAWKASLSFRNGDVAVRSEWVIELESQNGSTKLTQRYQYTPIHEQSKKMMSDVPKTLAIIDKEIDGNLAQVKEILEERAADASYNGAQRQRETTKVP